MNQKKAANKVLSFKIFRTSEVHPYLDYIAQVRARYINFPYLYIPNGKPSQENVSHYKNSTGTMMAGAFDDTNTLVGFAIGLPLKDVPTTSSPEDAKISSEEKFKSLGIKIDTCFYVSEISVEPEYLNQGLENKLYDFLTQNAIGTNKYDAIGLMHMDRGNNHPLRPANFVDPELTIFNNNNFVKTGNTIIYQWNTLQPDGSIIRQDNGMNFWVKQLNKVNNCCT